MTDGYLWISNGGCERCDAMEGFHEEEPTRPHPNCRCDIIATDITERIGPDDCVYEYDIEETGRETHWDQDPPPLKASFEIVVFCWNGEEHRDQFDIEFEDGYAESLFDEWNSREEDAADTLAARCPPCPEDEPPPDNDDLFV